MVKVVMLLAQAPGQPEGNLEDRVELRLALTPQGQIDVAAHQNDATVWPAVRQRPGHDPRESEVIRLDETWALQSMRGDDDPLWTLDGNVFRPGELVRLGRPGGEDLLYRIVSVEAS